MGTFTEDDSRTFDYIIAGGGTAGCVIAARLAEDKEITVLIVEAGKSNTEVPASSIPAGTSQITGSENDWRIKSEPSPGVNGRQLDLSRGKFLGGSSGCNGALAIRGSREDYDQWDLDGWNGDEIFAYMSKAENYHSASWFTPGKGVHGTNGHLHISPYDPCPISKLVLQAYQEKGFPLIPDVFTTGESPHACGHALRTIREGIRSTAADYVTNKNEKPNVTIKTEVLVDKVILETNDDGAKRATGVQLQGLDGKKFLVKARKEIIVCGGSFGSPAILLRSGIGPKEELQKLGIRSEVDLKGVGRNLMDHPLIVVLYEVSKPGLTTDHLIWHSGAKARSLSEYQTHHTGFFSQFPFGTFAFARLTDRLSSSKTWQKAQKQHAQNGRDAMGLTQTQPHVEIWNTECYGPKGYVDAPPNDKHAFAMITTLFGGQSRGEVTLKSADPMQNPVVDHKHLSDERDLLVLAEGCRLANEIVMEGQGTKAVIKGSWPSHLTHHLHKERGEWEDYVKQKADTCYHPAGTCKMGKDDDDMAVLDAQLRVRGVEGLRVADASVMPLLMGGHPQLAVYAIGEKAADMIKESRNGKA